MDRVWCIPEFTYGPTKEFCRSSLYFQTLQACWEETYYNKQKKLMVHYLRLQSQGQVPPHVSTEHMSNWLVSQSKKSLRERVWKETLEEGNNLARLAWEVNTCLKMMDMEHDALTMAVFATLPADIQAEDVAVVIPDVTPHVTKDVTRDVPCRARKGAVRRLFCRLWRAVCCIHMPSETWNLSVIISHHYYNDTTLDMAVCNSIHCPCMVFSVPCMWLIDCLTSFSRI